MPQTTVSMLQIQRIALPPGVWTPVSLNRAASANSIVISNPGDLGLLVRTERDSMATQDTLPAHAQQVLAEAALGGQLLCYMMPSTAEDALVILRYT